MSHVQGSSGKLVHYPDSDGKRRAENTLHFSWIATVQGNLDASFLDDPNVFVAGDLLWYPVEGRPDIRQAPDILLAFGRPKGDRGSYKQWMEGNVAPQMVWEFLYPELKFREMLEKFLFYERYGVEEFIVFDPHSQDLSVYCRAGERLVEVVDSHKWVSPRTGVRFDFSGPTMRVIGPDNRPFLTYVELAAYVRALGVEPQA